jgi:prevent-host-death family protein
MVVRSRRFPDFPTPAPGQPFRFAMASAMSLFISLYDAKTRLSALVDRAAAGEEIVIAKNGVPCARLVPIQQRGEPRRPANIMRMTYIAPDFDDPDPRIEAMFGGDPV